MAEKTKKNEKTKKKLRKIINDSGLAIFARGYAGKEQTDCEVEALIRDIMRFFEEVK